MVNGELCSTYKRLGDKGRGERERNRERRERDGEGRKRGGEGNRGRERFFALSLAENRVQIH